jgi:hypothetical protein
MSDEDVIKLAARLERFADVVEPRLAGFYAAVASTAVITIIMPAIAGALGRILS